MYEKNDQTVAVVPVREGSSRIKDKNFVCLSHILFSIDKEAPLHSLIRVLRYS